MTSNSCLPSSSIPIIITLLCCFRVDGADMITANQTLSGDQTIVSAGGLFKLGFFTPGNTSKHYIGIWYSKVSIETIVWVANRQAPISDRFKSELKISNGNLVLVNSQSQVPVWSTNLNSTGSNPAQAVIQDDGNLVLRDGFNVSLWESFEYPTHTWLPGGKIGLNKKARTNQVLTSWKNREDPAPGLFSLVLDPNGTSQYIILWKGTERYWTSGVWDNRTKIFSKVPEMRSNYLYDFAYVDNENESYFTYSMQNPSSFISRFVMDVSGQVKQFTWLTPSKQWNQLWSQPRTQCEVYALCGEFGTCSEDSSSFCSCLKGFEPRSWSMWNLSDYSDGCARTVGLQCTKNFSNKRQDEFLPRTNMRLPVHSQDVAATSVNECEKSCLDNCSCTAYAYSTKCQIWDDGLLNLQQYATSVDTGDTLFIRLDASKFPNAKSKTGMIIGIVAGVIVLSALVIFFFLMRRRGRRAIKVGKLDDRSLVPFGYRDLQAATKNFSDKIGGGAFGSVYKGILPDSTVIAVKKLEGISQGEKQFRTEVSTIGTIQHLNLVRLRGFCSEGTNKLLVYDCMPNGSLDAHLFDKQKTALNWRTRYQIALGTARGLHYLHEKCRDCIIHCDIKPENILLDAKLYPKIADFGLAKLMGREFSRVLTTMRGTRGYLAPEWLSGVAITAKADVYSYGMMLFELISGRRNFSQHGDVNIKFFPTYAANKIIKRDDVTELLDNILDGNADISELTRACKVACWCVQDDETQRPSMGQIVQILEGVSEVNMPPFPRSLQLFVDNQENSMVFFTESCTSQSSRLAYSLGSSSVSYQAKSTTSSN
ncbi:unnamed protein product [Rhodiola kirilowii]